MRGIDRLTDCPHPPTAARKARETFFSSDLLDCLAHRIKSCKKRLLKTF